MNYYNYNYNYDTYNTGAELAGTAIAFIVIFGLIVLALAVVAIIANYKLFKKMGLEGWKSLIPMVNNYLQMGATGVNQKWLVVLTFGYFIMFIPFLGMLAYMVAVIYFQVLICVSLAKSFGKETPFAVGLFFLYPIFIMILAFSDAKYIGKNPMNDIIFSTEEALKQADEAKVEVVSTKKETGETTAKKTCLKCGEKVSDAEFCTNCGNKM